VLAGSAVAVGLCWHAARRLTGVTGDVLGASCESAVLAAATVLALS
jgi:cobalamin synthase